MGERTFFQPDARARVTATIKAIEGQTSAEVVVAVRNASGTYRDVDYLVGFGVSLVALVVLLFHPHPFALEGMPLDLVLAFTLGTVVSAKSSFLRRLFVRRARKDDNARTATRAAFVELGVGRTKDRNGLLVLVSIFERRACLVADVGIDPVALGPEWKARVDALEASLEGIPSIDRFVTALAALGPPLAAAMPRQDDDVNELPDEVA